MSRLDAYSKWDSLNSDDEEEDKTTNTSQRQMNDMKLHGLKPVDSSRAWTEIATLQKIADGIFFKAEEMHGQSSSNGGSNSSKQEYQSAYKHYEEVLRLVSGALTVEKKAAEAAQSDADKKKRADADVARGKDIARKHVVSCHLNLACCSIRASRWTEASKHCKAAISSHHGSFPLSSDTQGGTGVSSIEELRARHILLHCHIQIAKPASATIQQYKAMGVDMVQDSAFTAQLDAIQEDITSLSQVLHKKDVSESSTSTGYIEQAVNLIKEATAFIQANAKEAPVLTSMPMQKDVNASKTNKINENEVEISQSNQSKTHTGTGDIEENTQLLPHAGTSLQEAAQLYREKKFIEAYVVYQRVLEKTPPIPVSNKEDWKAAEQQGLTLIRAVTLSGMGSCHTAMKEYDMAVAELSVSLKDFIKFIQLGIKQRTEVLQDDTVPTTAIITTSDDESYETTSTSTSPLISETQLLTTARHAWNNMDNIMECHARLHQWIRALDVCDKATSLSTSFLELETLIKKALHDAEATVTEISEAFSSEMKAMIIEAKHRLATTLLAQGHILHDMVKSKDKSTAGRQACQQYTERMQAEANKHRKMSTKSNYIDEDDIIEDIDEKVLWYWQRAGQQFSALSSHEKAADVYGLMANKMYQEAALSPSSGNHCNNSKKLQLYLDWLAVGEKDSLPEIDRDKATCAHEFYHKEAAEAVKAITIVEKEMANIAREHDESVSKKNTTSSKADENTQKRIKMLQQERFDILLRVLNSSLNASISALYANQPGTSLTDAERSLEVAHTAYASFIKKSPLHKFLSKSSRSYSNLQAILADCKYHSALACFRNGKIDCTIDYTTDALQYSIECSDYTRQQYALGLRSLAHTVRGMSKEAEDDIVAAGSLVKLPIEQPDIIKQQVRMYIRRNLPQQVAKNINNMTSTPKMMPLDPADAARRKERDTREATTASSSSCHTDKFGQPKNMRIEKFDDNGNIIDDMVDNRTKEGFVERMQTFLTGDGTLNLIVAWSIVIASIAVIMAAVVRMLDKEGIAK